MPSVPVFREIVDGAVLVRFPEAGDREANHAAVALSAAAAGLSGVLDAVPAARSVLILFEPSTTSARELRASLEAHRSRGERSARGNARRLRVPVLYGGEAGPDLAELATSRGLSEPDFAALHAAAEYEVAFLGFSPGFAYLAGLPEGLHEPRLATPRTRIAAGSVAIGGPYTGIYPEGTPGGWRLIGRAPVRLFDPHADPPALLSPGDAVCFESIGKEEFDRALARLSSMPSRPELAEGTPLLRIGQQGVWTSVQGAPRYGWSRWGVPPGGALDADALAAGNAVVGNHASETALEISLIGPEFEVLSPFTAVLAGARTDPRRNDRPFVSDRPFRLGRGDHLSVGPLRDAARAYLCVEGGIALPPGVLPSLRLSEGQVVCASSRAGRRTPAAELRRVVRVSSSHPAVVRVVLGPDEDRFSREGVATFLSSPYRVSSVSDRRGIRLEGPAVSHSGSPDVPPEATPLGGIQIARDGQPIVLGPDRPVTGGYARIATVIGADFPLVARSLPGSVLRFRSVRISEALEARSKLPASPGDSKLPSRKEKA